jgi:hypothetical protein
MTEMSGAAKIEVTVKTTDEQMAYARNVMDACLPENMRDRVLIVAAEEIGKVAKSG